MVIGDRPSSDLPATFGPVRLLERWDEHNRRVLVRHNERVTEPPEEDPGPRWAWAIYGLPFIGWIGALAIAVAWWRRRRAGR